MINLNYTGKIFLNCAGAGQKSALAADSAFGSTLRQSYGTDFSEAQGIFNSLNGNLESVIAKGPGQQGETAEELAAQNSQAINTAAAANKQIQQSIGEKASMSGAVPGVESGVTQAVRAGAEAQVENNLANTEANITQKNYDIGREQYNTAVKEQAALPQATMAPVTQAGEATTTANEVTGKEATDVQNSSSSWMGLVGGLASSAAKAYAA
jgi:hypothetical protein